MKASYKTKILLVGQSESENLDFILDSMENKFNFSQKSAERVKILTKDIQISSGTKYDVEIWIIDWKERFNYIRSKYFFNTSGLILIFDLFNAQTWCDIQICKSELAPFLGKVPIVLVGNKVSISSEKCTEMELDECIQYAEENDGKFYNFDFNSINTIETVILDILEQIDERNKKTAKLLKAITEFYVNLIMSEESKQISYQNMDAFNELFLEFKIGWHTPENFLCRYFKGFENKKLKKYIKPFNPRHRLEEKLNLIVEELKSYLNETKIWVGIFSTLSYMEKLVGSLKDGKMTPSNFIIRLNNF